jgi:RecA-family ATPase
MRLAGFIHRKGVPFRSRLVQTSDHAPYEWSEFRRIFDNVVQLDLTRKNGGEGKTASTPLEPTFTPPSGLEHLDPDEDLAEGLRDKKWWDRLSLEQKDAALDHGLECIAKNSKRLELWVHGGDGYDNWFGITASVARSGAPRAENIFVKHASTATNHDPEDVLRQKFKDCQKNPRADGFTIGTFIHRARECGADFGPWLDGDDDTTTNGVSGFSLNPDGGGNTEQQDLHGRPPLLIELGSKLWGPPTLNGKEYRYGADQSKVIDLRRGYWFDFEANEGGNIRELIKKVTAAANHADTPPLVYVDIAKWIGAPVPQRLWAVLNRIPANNVTVLSGTGGIGKTIIAMLLAAAIVLGREWFGVMPEQGPVIFVSGEEPEQEMHRRFADIVQHLDVSYQDLIDGGLHLIDKAGRNAMLACPGPNGVLITTPFLKQLAADAQRLKPKLVILDNRNMVYGGNINDPTQVSDFINTMHGFAIDADTSVLLLLHPSMAGMAATLDSSHQGLAGAMNWHDLPRGRMYFNRVKTDDDKEIDKDLRQLVCKKNNYGPDDETITLRWKTGTNGSGVFVMEPKPGSLEAMATTQKAEEFFLSSLQRLNDQNRGPFSHKKQSNNYAPKAFAELPEAKAAGVRKTALAQAMDRLINTKKITIQPYGPPSRDNHKLVISENLEPLAAITAWKAAIDVNATRSLDHVIKMADVHINPDLNAAFLAVAAMDDGQTISNVRLKRWLDSHNEVPLHGLMLSNSNDGDLWTLLPANQQKTLTTPFPLTRAMREQLQQCGLSHEQITQLTSEQQAQDIIRERLPQADYRNESQ